MSVLYHCPHLDESRHPPSPSSYPSSSSSFSPLGSLYFCEECDAVRCNQCVAVEIAGYYCPDCLFDVPNANVRADRNRCARSCFTCPRCCSSLKVEGTDSVDPNHAGQLTSGSPFILSCSYCKWSSKGIGWKFEKSSGIAVQASQLPNPTVSAAKAEFDALKDHLDAYITSTSSEPQTKRQPSRHISHLTQMAARALHRDVSSARPRSKLQGRLSDVSTSSMLGQSKENSHSRWDEIKEYKAKSAWKDPTEAGDIGSMTSLDVVSVDRTWRQSWEGSSKVDHQLPERTELHAKLTKRCPHPGCRHLLIQPDIKTVRYKIKMVALNYLPAIELGRRRSRLNSGDLNPNASRDEIERRRRDRRRTRLREDEEDEPMDRPLRAGGVYSYQLAFTNPLYDPIQIRLSQPLPPRDAPPLNHHLHIPTQHFTIAALKDAWAYDEDDEDDDLPGMEGSSEVPSEEGTLASGTLGRRNRLSLLAGGSGAMREKRGRGEAGVEKKANMTKVEMEVEVLPGATGNVTFDLEVRYTYRAEEAITTKDDKDDDGKQRSDHTPELKTFTFWVRIDAGAIGQAS